MDEKILEFTVFCIDSLAEYLNKDTKEVYYKNYLIVGIVTIGRRF